MKILLSTKNRHKLKEISEIFVNSGYEIESAYDYVEDMVIEESGNSFEENAILKAVEISKLTDHYVIADDSGIVVDALGGAPGIYSARFAGENTTDDENNKLLLEKLGNLPMDKRTAKYVCAIALAKGGKLITTTLGECEGFIGYEYKGTNGFGYDPIFVLPDGRHMAELSPEEKNSISHRFKALISLKRYLEQHQLK